MHAGKKLADVGRQYSEESATALKRLDSIDRKFEGITDRISNVASLPTCDIAVKGDSVSKLLQAKHELAQISGDLERLQFREVRIWGHSRQINGSYTHILLLICIYKLYTHHFQIDAVETAKLTSGKSEARIKRKSLNTAVDDLLRRTQDLHRDYVTIIEKLQSEPQFKDTSAEPPPFEQSNRRRATNYSPSPQQAGDSAQNPLMWQCGADVT
jgi:hypothetical protein